jgi:predicted phage-related endonuclease
VGDQVNRADWLEWRRGGIGGSDVAAILGVSPWRTEFDVWASKVAPDVVPERDSAEFQRDRGKSTSLRS